jgi:ABC-type multidrug transport system fused ATPase/permease subunit
MNNPYFDLIRAVWQYGKPWRASILGYYLAFIVAQAFLSLAPYALGRTIDVLQHFKPGDLSQVIFWLAFGVGVELLFWLFHGPARVVERKVALKIQQAFQLKFYEQLTRLPLKWHQDHHSGNIITRMNRSSAALRRFASDQFVYIETIVRFVTSVGFLLWISVPIGVVSLLSSSFIIGMLFLFDRKLIPLYSAENEVENRVGAVLFDYVSNMTTIITLRLSELTHSNLFQRIMAVWPFYRKEVILNETKWFSMMFLLSVFQAIILIGYTLYTFKTTGTILIGLVVMIIRYQQDLENVFRELSSHWGDIVHMDTDVKGIKPILDDMDRLAHIPQGEAMARQWHILDIQNLSFHHAPGSERGQIFNSINFKIKRGEKVALIGLSGGGKSTLMNLLCGLYIPSQVTLKIDDVSFDSLEPLQAITTLIPQDPEIFENTIAFNIAMDLPTEPEEIHRVIKLAGFSDVLTTLPDGLKTDIREKGLNFSVGQKQRLALARGLFAARFSSLILMDEPTSSVDFPTEKEILSGVLTAFEDAAMIVSIHRLHLLPKFDRIIMLSQGEIVANGITAELLNNPGPVYDLWQAYQQDDGG